MIFDFDSAVGALFEIFDFGIQDWVMRGHEDFKIDNQVAIFINVCHEIVAIASPGLRGLSCKVSI